MRNRRATVAETSHMTISAARRLESVPLNLQPLDSTRSLPATPLIRASSDGVDAPQILYNIATPTIPPPLPPAPPPGGDFPPVPDPRDKGIKKNPDGTLSITSTLGGGGGGAAGLAVAGGVLLVRSLIGLFRGGSGSDSSGAGATSGSTAPAPNHLDRLMSLPGTRSYPNIAAAGAGAGQEAYQATFKSAGDPQARVEYGALIFEYQGKTFTAPLTAGNSQQDGQAKVSPNQLMIDLLRHIGQAGIRPSEIKVVGLVHSHPEQPGFQVPLDPDIMTYNTMKGWKTWENKGGVPVDFQRSYIWGPRNSQLGGRDPVGQIYSYPPP